MLLSYWASIALSWRGFRTRIIYSYFQTNVNKSLVAWTGKFVRALSQKRGPVKSRGALRSAPDTGQHQQLLKLKLMFDIPVLLKQNTRVELRSLRLALHRKRQPVKSITFLFQPPPKTNGFLTVRDCK